MKEEYVKIIALDFDGCIVVNKWPEIGEPIEKNIKKIKEEIVQGAKVILWTSRSGERLNEAINFCYDQGIRLDAVNDNLFGFNTRKIFANEYWDDRAVHMSEKDIGEFSDGYHTFNDLYRQRLILSAVLFNTYKERAWKSANHSDGQPCFGGGWFIVGIDTPLGQYAYHFNNHDWNMFDVKELNTAPEWDGHTDKDVDRLMSLLKEHQTCDGCMYDEEYCANPKICNKTHSGYTGYISK
jgi:hypothetical protein